MAPQKYVVYLRVSTQMQGRSGLGLEAQRAAIAAYLNGGDWQTVAEFVEVESGARNNRPELARAFQACRLYGAKLLIAKIDRLSRDAAFLLGLRSAGIEFVAADMPDANEMTVGIMAVVAQAERKMISERTKAALGAAKARGQTLGGFRRDHAGNPLSKPPTAAHRAKAVERRRSRAIERAKAILPAMVEIRAAGINSLTGIARALQERGIPAPRGGNWSAQTVKALIAWQAQ